MRIWPISGVMALTEVGTDSSLTGAMPVSTMSAIADRPDFCCFAGQRSELVYGEFHDHLVKPADATLVRTENECADNSFMRPLTRRAFGLCERNRLRLVETRNQCELQRAIVVSQRLDCLFVLSNAGCRQGLHRTNDAFEIPRAVDFSTQTLHRTAHGEALAADLGSAAGLGLEVDLGAAAGFGPGAGLGLGVGWNGTSACVAISRIAFRSSSLNLSADVNRPSTSAGISAVAFWSACSAPSTFSIGTASN